MRFKEVDFNKMTARNMVVYKGLWDGCFSDLEVEPTSAGGNTTYRISGDIKEASKVIRECFQIENPDVFDKKYKMAVGGNGEEENKILTLHSSSRCSLLAFYNIDKKHTRRLTLEGKEIVFDFSVFEFKNPVIRFPSNMDVVLLSDDRKSVLFLESKFSEYYIGASDKSSPISNSYLKHKYSEPFFDAEWLSSIGIKVKEHSEKTFELVTMDNSQNYLDGYKQMISHYVGIMQRLEGKKITGDDTEEANDILSAVADPETTIYLGEVLYDRLRLPSDCGSVLDPKDAYRNYSRLYCNLAEKMNKENHIVGKGNRFVVLGEELRYSDIFSSQVDIEPFVHDFYRM